MDRAAVVVVVVTAIGRLGLLVLFFYVIPLRIVLAPCLVHELHH
jgi:hypothetical protein